VGGIPQLESIDLDRNVADSLGRLSRSSPPASESEIKEYFEKHRHEVNNPNENRVGFRQRDKIAIAYFKGDIAPFLEQAKAEVTEEQIAAYYEANKDSFRKPALPPAEPETSPEATEDVKEGEKPEDSDSGAMSETPENKPAEDSPADDTNKQKAEEAPEGNQEESSNKETQDDKPTAEETEKSADEPESEENAAEEKPATEDNSQLLRSREIQLVNFLQDEDEEATSEEEKPENEPAKDPQPEEGNTDASKEEPVKESLNDAAPAATSAPAPSTSAPMPAEQNVEYKSLEEVKETIRSNLAQPIAQEKLTNALNEVRAELQFAYEDYRYEQEESESPAEFSVEATRQKAESLGLTYGVMPLSDLSEAFQTSLGEEAVHTRYVRDPVRMFRQESLSLVQEAFSTATPQYQPRLFPGPGGQDVLQLQAPDVQYVWWKTELKDGYAPKLEDVRDLVIETWRKEKAAEMAKQQAEKLAAEIKSAEDLKKQADALNAEPIVAESITYYNQLSAINPQQGLQPTEVPGVEKTALETLDALFAAPVQEATVAPNADKSVYYVAIVTSEQDSPEKLREDMLNAIQGQLPGAVQGSAMQDQAFVNQAILFDFFDPSRIQWKIDPEDLDS